MVTRIGHIVSNDKNVHVCGYEGNKILFQTHAGGKMFKRKMFQNIDMTYFTYQSKKYILE